MPRLTLRVTEEMYQQIDTLAKAQEDSLSTIAKQLITQGLYINQHNTSAPVNDNQSKISLETLFLLKKLLYEHFEYTQTDFEKVREIVRKKVDNPLAHREADQV